MRKIIWTMAAIVAVNISYVKIKFKPAVSPISRTFTTATTENAKSVLDKYLSDFEFKDKWSIKNLQRRKTPDSALFAPTGRL